MSYQRLADSCGVARLAPGWREGHGYAGCAGAGRWILLDSAAREAFNWANTGRYGRVLPETGSGQEFWTWQEVHQGASIYTHRTAGGHCHHRHSCRVASARALAGQTGLDVGRLPGASSSMGRRAEICTWTIMGPIRHGRMLL